MRTSMFFVIVLFLAAVFIGSVRAQVPEGMKIYIDKCASCHAKDGSGDTARGRVMKVPDLRTPKIQKKTDDQLLEAIMKSNAHRAFRTQIGDEGTRMAIAHMRTMKK
jgi:mono/diheme cytochrome c family protein